MAGSAAKPRLYRVGSGLRTDLGPLKRGTGDRIGCVLVHQRPKAAALPDTLSPQPDTRRALSACPNGVRHHRVHATEPDPNRRGEAARLARSANPTRGRRGRRTPHNGRDAVAPLGKTSHWPWIDVPVIGSVSFHRIRAALQEDQYDTNRGPPRGGLPPFSRFASILNKLGAAYRRG